MRKSYEERARKFLEQIYPYIKDCEDNFDFSLAIRKFNHDYKRNVKYSYGSTRIAMITSDYVIKVDYDGWGSGRFGSCEDEVEMYQRAEMDGFEYLFAKITPIQKEEYNRTFYIMPKITGIGKEPWDADHYLEGKEYYYICEHVGDLHNQNYGWKDGHIVMIDYAFNSMLEDF